MNDYMRIDDAVEVLNETLDYLADRGVSVNLESPAGGRSKPHSVVVTSWLPNGRIHGNRWIRLPRKVAMRNSVDLDALEMEMIRVGQEPNHLVRMDMVIPIKAQVQKGMQHGDFDANDRVRLKRLMSDMITVFEGGLPDGTP